MAWDALVETVIDMRLSILFTNLLMSSTECDDTTGEISQQRQTMKNSTDLNHPSSFVWL